MMGGLLAPWPPPRGPRPWPAKAPFPDPSGRTLYFEAPAAPGALLRTEAVTEKGGSPTPREGRAAN